MKIIDAHQHYFARTHTLEDLIKRSTDAGIVKVCLSACGEKFEQPGNDAVKQAFNLYPDMIIGFGYVRLGIDSPSLVDKLHDEGFKGLKVINPKKNYNDKEYYLIYEKAARYKMPILFHTGIMGRQPRDGEFDTACERVRPIFLDGIARAFPELILIGAHLGVPWYNEACAVARFNPNVFFDLSGAVNLLYEMEPWFFETLTYWNMAKEKFIFGVDDHYKGIMGSVNKFNTLMDKLSFPQELKEKIFYGNMEKILGL